MVIILISFSNEWRTIDGGRTERQERKGREKIEVKIMIKLELYK